MERYETFCDRAARAIAAVQFCAAYSSCILIPIYLCIEESRNKVAALPVAIFVCDLIVLATKLKSLQLGYTSRTILVVSCLPTLAWFVADVPRLDGILTLGLVKVTMLNCLYDSVLQTSRCAQLSDTASRITAVGLCYILYASSMASIWFGLSCTFSDHPGDHCLARTSWVSSDVSNEFMDFDCTSSRYFRSLHYITQTLATIGYGDIHPVTLPETLFSLVLLLSGALFYGYVISCITSLLSNQDVTTKLFRNLLVNLKDYLKLRKVPESVRDKFTAYFDFLYTRQKGLSEEAVLQSLPSKVAQDLRNQCCLQILRTVPFFKTRPDCDALTTQCLQRVTFTSYGPGSVLSGQACDERFLFLIRSGKVDLISPVTQKPALSLIAGDYFGDYHMLFDSPLDMEAVSTGFTEVATLRYDCFSRTVFGTTDLTDVLRVATTPLRMC
jgi:hypothetical protein